MLVSPCCHAPARPFYAGDYTEDTTQRSNWFVCTKCWRDCDPMVLAKNEPPLEESK